jgi:predicted regulator of Ras-like GTPase activity (Roadblock/LC7/MglB family)
MSWANMVIMQEDHERFISALDLLREESNAKFAVLLDKAGQQIASVGELNSIDPTALASLAAGNVAATEGLAELIGEDAFTTLFHEGSNDSLHISLVSERVILLISFDEQSSLGLVRLRVQQHSPQLAAVVQDVMARSASPAAAASISSGSVPEITDEDIDALFG